MHYHRSTDYSSQSAAFQNELLAAIQNEANGIQFYKTLVNLAPNQKHKHKLFNIIEDESKHLHQFTALYSQLTGFKPIYEMNEITIHSYERGIEEAIEDELRDYDMYRRLILQTNNPMIQNVLLQAYLDEMKHAVQLTNLLQLQTKDSNPPALKDYGSQPFVINIEEAAKQNKNFRTALWTGKYLQLTLMSIDVDGEIGLEIHPETDQFLRIEQGSGIVLMGDEKNQLTFKKNVGENDIIIIPAGKWHNVINTGKYPMKIYSIYAPPNHPFGTIQITKEIEID